MLAFYAVKDAEGFWTVRATTRFLEYVGNAHCCIESAWKHAEQLAVERRGIYTVLPDGFARPVDDEGKPRACWLVQ